MCAADQMTIEAVHGRTVGPLGPLTPASLEVGW